MKKLMKLAFGLVFSLGFLISANAQTDTSMQSAPDDIVCVQVEENVFECALMDENFGTEPNEQQDLFHEGSPEEPEIMEEGEGLPEQDYNKDSEMKEDEGKSDDSGGDVLKEDTGSASNNDEAKELEIKVKC